MKVWCFMLASHLKTDIIVPVLKRLDLYSESATNLLLGTAAVETELGKYLHQINGPALGVYQPEPNNPKSGHDLVINWLTKRKSTLFDKVWSLRSQNPSISTEEELRFNLYYQTAIARCLYYAVPKPLPKANDIKGLAIYWKKYYNTFRGKGTVEKFVNAYNRYVLNTDN
jgi:hypothetical protein